MSENARALPIACPLCGGEDVLAPADGAASSAVVCQSCGSELGRYGDIVELIRKAAAERMSELDGMIARAEKDT